MELAELALPEFEAFEAFELAEADPGVAAGVAAAPVDETMMLLDDTTDEV